MQARARTNKRDDWTLWDMLRIKVDNEPVLQPGKLTMKYDEKLYEAQLLKDGIIKYGKYLFYTPSGFSSHVIYEAQNKKVVKTRAKSTSDGWKLVKYNGIILEILRTKAGITTKRTKSKLQPTKEKMIDRMNRLKEKEVERNELIEKILKRVERISEQATLTRHYLNKYNTMVIKMNQTYSKDVPIKSNPKEMNHFLHLWKRLCETYGSDLSKIKSLKITNRVNDKLLSIACAVEKEMNDMKRAKRRITRKCAGLYKAQLIN